MPWLDICFMPKASCVLHFSTSCIWVSEAAQTWVFCLNVMAFMSKQISVRKWLKWLPFSTWGRGLDKMAFEMPSNPIFSLLLCHFRKEQNLLNADEIYSKSLTKKDIYLPSTQRDPKCHTQICNMENLNHWKSCINYGYKIVISSRQLKIHKDSQKYCHFFFISSEIASFSFHKEKGFFEHCAILNLLLTHIMPHAVLRSILSITPWPGCLLFVWTPRICPHSSFLVNSAYLPKIQVLYSPHLS